MSLDQPQKIRHHLKIRLIPLINRLIHSSWRSKILYLRCDDFASFNENKCIIAANEQINYHSDIFQVVLEDLHLPFQDDFFDVIIIDLSRYHRTEHNSILQESYRVLKSSGKALICNQNITSPNFISHIRNKNTRTYSSLKKIIKTNRFQILTEYPLSFALFNQIQLFNKFLIKKERVMRRYFSQFSNYHCIQVYKSKGLYQPLPNYIRLSKTINVANST